MGSGLSGIAAVDDAAVGAALTQGTACRHSTSCSESAATAGEGLAELDTDSSVVLYNLAALHFQQMQYGAARAILEHLFLHIEPMDEPLAILIHAARGSTVTQRRSGLVNRLVLYYPILRGLMLLMQQVVQMQHQHHHQQLVTVSQMVQLLLLLVMTLMQ
jgi:hypothetical protein